jgi:hypothetical protein
VGPAAYDPRGVRVLAKRSGLPSEFADQLTAASGVAIDDWDQALLDRLCEFVGVCRRGRSNVRNPRGSSTS